MGSSGRRLGYAGHRRPPLRGTGRSGGPCGSAGLSSRAMSTPPLSSRLDLLELRYLLQQRLAPRGRWGLASPGRVAFLGGLLTGVQSKALFPFSMRPSMRPFNPLVLPSQIESQRAAPWCDQMSLSPGTLYRHLSHHNRRLGVYSFQSSL